MRAVNARPGRPSTSRNDQNIERVRSFVLYDRRTTESNTGKLSVHTIFTDHLDLGQLCAKVVPKMMTPHPTKKSEGKSDAPTGKNQLKLLDFFTARQTWPPVT